MSYVLDITPRQQRSQMSCWWACVSMVIEYYEHRRYLMPGAYRGIFERPWNRPMTGLGDAVFLEDGAHMLAPYEWYDRGLPMTERALRRFCDITGFQPITNRPPFGQWTPDIIEAKLREFGPFLFVGNWNNQGFHAVLFIGRETTDLGDGAMIDEVVYVDPAMGMALRGNIEEINGKMSSVGLSTYNPLRYGRRPAAAAASRTASASRGTTGRGGGRSSGPEGSA
jgi:hypothetical protein